MLPAPIAAMAMPAFFSGKPGTGVQWSWGWKLALLVVLLSTGSADIIVNKFADMACAEGSEAFDKVEDSGGEGRGERRTTERCRGGRKSEIT